jgi:colanic acid biosynthesis protein WcaH
MGSCGVALPPEFATIVRHAPLVSIDLVVRDSAGRLLVGRRVFAPARNTWFVPGGRIRKGERHAEAFARISMDELGIALSPESARFLGVFDHLYPENALGEPGYGTHYVVLAYEVRIAEPLQVLPDEQHTAYRWLTDEEALADPEVHPNTKAYCGK